MTKNIYPSYSIEAEQSVLGGLLIDNNCWDTISDILNEHHFYTTAHKLIFATMRTMFESNQAVDLITLERTLKEKKLDRELGGFAYLAELSRYTPSVANILSYAQIIKRDAQSRILFALGNELRSESAKINSQERLNAIIEKTEKKLTELTFNQFDNDHVVSINEAIETILYRMEQSTVKQSSVTGVSFGIERLDYNTAGAQNGDLIILAARPSMGKTALSLKFAETALDTVSDKPIQYYSLEMPADQLMQRFLSMRSRVANQKLRQAIQMDDYDWARVGEAISYIKSHWENRLLIDDNSYLTPQLLRTKVRRNARKYGLPSIIIVDYLQLMTDLSQDGKNRNLEIANISRALKSIAKEMNCPVIALSQLNRNVEQRHDKRPMSADLRDSGSLEQDADLLMFIYQDEVYHRETDMPGIAEIIIAKQRNGPIGTVMSRFIGEYSSFDNIPEDEYQKLMN